MHDVGTAVKTLETAVTAATNSASVAGFAYLVKPPYISHGFSFIALGVIQLFM